MPNINDELVFVCPSCGATEVEEVIDGATVRSKLVYLSPEGDHDYETTPVIEGGKIKEFRCCSCQAKVPCEPNHQALSDWLLDNQADEDVVEETDGVEDASEDMPETDEVVAEEEVPPEEKEN
ncbi:MAG TPA: hypothetical protein DET40_02705 [Lentisphaeria bacterium]|nr:MAG: hypothetical protein A2X45_13895 [Lentisphaerae bacterium GWF2_50_93]HCE42441.1 hypothetical protein [Lentisphaeria bacterium]